MRKVFLAEVWLVSVLLFGVLSVSAVISCSLLLSCPLESRVGWDPAFVPPASARL